MTALLIVLVYVVTVFALYGALNKASEFQTGKELAWGAAIANLVIAWGWPFLWAYYGGRAAMGWALKRRAARPRAVEGPAGPVSWKVPVRWGTR